MDDLLITGSHDGQSPYERAHWREIGRGRAAQDEARAQRLRARGEPPDLPEEQPRHFEPAPQTIQEAAIAEYRLANAALHKGEAQSTQQEKGIGSGSTSKP